MLDNFDSFTYNLADYLMQAGVKCQIFRNDQSLDTISQLNYSGVVLSPGPGAPENAGNLMKVVEFYSGKLPVLGICLGHQAIGSFFGAQLKKGKQPMHGKISEIIHKNDPIFQGIQDIFKVVRYHSLIIDSLPDCLESLATTLDGEIMSIKHKSLPIYGLQYHPEAIMTEFGNKILENWILLNNIPH